MMLRGAQKRIIEVVDMENEYFEKAILFVKEEQAPVLPVDEKQKSLLKQRARDYVAGIHYQPVAVKVKPKIFFSLLKLISAAGVGALLAAAFLRF